MEAEFADGQILYDSMKYQAVILCDMGTAFPEFIDALTTYAETGGKIIFLGKTPTISPGMKYKGDRKTLEKTFQLIKKFPKNVFPVPAPQQDTIIEWAGKQLK